MWLALLKMCVVSNTHQRYKPSSLVYENIRIAAGKENSGKNSPTYGRTPTPAQIAQGLETRKRNNLSKQPYTHSEAAKLKIGKSKVGRARPDMVEIMRQNNKKINHNTNTGKHWYNDGVKSYLRKECPEGCVLGRLN